MNPCKGVKKIHMILKGVKKKFHPNFLKPSPVHPHHQHQHHQSNYEHSLACITTLKSKHKILVQSHLHTIWAGWLSLEKVQDQTSKHFSDVFWTVTWVNFSSKLGHYLISYKQLHSPWYLDSVLCNCVIYWNCKINQKIDLISIWFNK